MLQFNFKIADIVVSVNTVADLLSRRELKVTEKIRVKTREDIQTTPIEVTTSSSDVVDEEELFFTQTYNEKESKEPTLKRKEHSGQVGKQWVANEKPPLLKTRVKDFAKIDGNTTSYCIKGNKANARIRIEQDVNPVLKNLKLPILVQPHDKVLIATNQRYKHCQGNENRIIHINGLLFRKFYGETGSAKYYKILIPKQLVSEVFRSLHGEIEKHPGIRRTIIAYREKYYYPNMAQFSREWIMSCDQCIKESRIDYSLKRLPQQNPNEHINAPEDAMQTDLVPKLPPSGDYEKIVTAMGVFSHYLFSYPTSNQDTETFAEIIIHNMIKQGHLPTTFFPDEGSAFVSQVNE